LLQAIFVDGHADMARARGRVSQIDPGVNSVML